MPSIPTLTIRLFDIPLKHDPAIMKMLLVGAGEETAKALRTRPEAGVDASLFHNHEVGYSGIQLATYKQSIEYTAIGAAEVQTLGYWFDVFEKKNSSNLDNTVLIHERYTPAFLQEQRKYQVRTLLISDELAKELNDINDKFARMDKLEKYLFGNLQTFFKHIGYTYDKQQNFLKITVQEIGYYSRAMPVYHGEKKTAFDITFLCNFLLPQSLRLGQSTAIGYGKVV